MAVEWNPLAVYSPLNIATLTALVSWLKNATKAESDSLTGRGRYRRHMKIDSLANFESMTLRRELLHFGWVGPLNFLIGYGSFLFFLYLFSRSDYWLALTASHFFSSSVAFALYRRFVFGAAGNLLTDYLRFQSTYFFAFVLNFLFLLLFVETMGWRVDLAQFVALIVVAGATFIAHKYFSFSRREGQNRENK